jgi:hypothetical protein
MPRGTCLSSSKGLERRSIVDDADKVIQCDSGSCVPCRRGSHDHRLLRCGRNRGHCQNEATTAGTIVAVQLDDFIVKTPGADGGRLNAMVSYANKLEAKNYPYVYGGGHQVVGVASGSGSKKGLDCSAVVAAVHASDGVWPKRSSVPSETGVVEDLLHRRLIASGPASGAYQVALFDTPGKDIQMKIGGRFCGTGGGRRGGAGWVDEVIVLPKEITSSTTCWRVH